MECARVLSQHEFDATLVFVAFAGEEQGLVGAHAMARRLKSKNQEIEAVLNRHPAIIESRVFGRMHPHLGEVVEAEIVLSAPDASTENLSHFCREHLAAFKIPTRFHVVPALLRTSATGKIRRVAAAA